MLTVNHNTVQKNKNDQLKISNKVCVIGLGYVGLTLAVYLACRGKIVHGIDISTTILDTISKGKAHFYEKDFDKALSAVIETQRLTVGNHYEGSEQNTTFIVTVGTPLDNDKKVNLNALKTVINNTASILQDGDTVILRSTVKVGTTRQIKQLLDNSKKSYYLGFCPERTLEGSAFKELSSLPQIISAIDEASLTKIDNFFKPICRETLAMRSLEEAEMVKLLNNSERDLSFALANQIALMAEEKNLDAHRIIEAANYHYPRSHLKKPGPVGGPCLEKDPYILTEAFSDSRHPPMLFVAGRQINESIIDHSLQRFFTYIEGQESYNTPQKIAVLGFAFKGKPATGDVRGSLVYQVITCIKDRYPNTSIIGHDYLATLEDIRHAGANIGTHDIDQALKDTDLVIMQNNHPQYQHENWNQLHHLLAENAMIYDFWNQLNDNTLPQQLNYFAFGKPR